MRFGTCYFVSEKAAISYYKEYHYTNTKEAVKTKLKEGSIHIGLPPRLASDKLTIEEGRYFIERK